MRHSRQPLAVDENHTESIAVRTACSALNRKTRRTPLVVTAGYFKCIITVGEYWQSVAVARRWTPARHKDSFESFLRSVGFRTATSLRVTIPASMLNNYFRHKKPCVFVLCFQGFYECQFFGCGKSKKSKNYARFIQCSCGFYEHICNVGLTLDDERRRSSH